MTIQDIVTDALLEPGIIADGETPSANQSTVVLKKLRRLLNNWNAEKRAVYANTFITNTLVPNLSPHTIGPTGATWTQTERPVSVDGASLILTGNPSPLVYLPITLRDDVWWNAQTVPALATSVPTDLYYSADWPNGSLYFWPVPNTAYDVRLMIRIVLNDTVNLTTTFDLPQGYQDAITLTLAHSICRMFGVDMGVTQDLMQQAKLARARIFSNNDQATRIQTADAGMQASKGNRPTWNYHIGSYFPSN